MAIPCNQPLHSGEAENDRDSQGSPPCAETEKDAARAGAAFQAVRFAETSLRTGEVGAKTKALIERLRRDCRHGYICFSGAGEVILDGEFTVKNLDDIVELLELEQEGVILDGLTL